MLPPERVKLERLISIGKYMAQSKFSYSVGGSQCGTSASEGGLAGSGKAEHTQTLCLRNSITRCFSKRNENITLQRGLYKSIQSGVIHNGPIWKRPGCAVEEINKMEYVIKAILRSSNREQHN